jgi:hypothetical protein
MNKKQLVVLWVTIGIVVALSLFPVRHSPAPVPGMGFRGRGFLFENKLTLRSGQMKVEHNSYVDLQTVIAEMIPFVIIGTGLIITLKDKKS